MNRRTFVTKTAAAGILAGMGGFGLSSFRSGSAEKHITILHTNDTHSHLEPFEADHPEFPGMGGIAKRYTAIRSIREENPNTLLLDAGDIFQGTPYFNFYGGSLEFKLMSMLGYDAATIGNHDLDNGIDGLYKQMPHAEFPFINSNYELDNTVLEDVVQPFKIFTLDGIRIGVFGLGIALEGLVSEKLYKGIRYKDPVQTTTTIVQHLKQEENCHLIICLSHLGYQYNSAKISDLRLAGLTEGIDLIIGGHTHTFLPEPTAVQNKKGHTVLVNQVGWAGIALGRIDFYLDNEKPIKNNAAVVMV